MRDPNVGVDPGHPCIQIMTLPQGIHKPVHATAYTGILIREHLGWGVIIGTFCRSTLWLQYVHTALDVVWQASWPVYAASDIQTRAILIETFPGSGLFAFDFFPPTKLNKITAGKRKKHSGGRRERNIEGRNAKVQCWRTIWHLNIPPSHKRYLYCLL